MNKDKKNNNEKSFLDIVFDIVKFFFLAITSPIWFPWKLLFRKNKEKERGTLEIASTAVLNTLKFVLFVSVIFIELIAIHKIRYSVLTYPLTRNSVREHYLNGSKLLDDGIEEEKREDFEKMLSYIDAWDLDERNKMHVILDSGFISDCLKYVDNETIFYVVDKFNNEQSFRDDVKEFIKEINPTVTRFINEIPKSDMERLDAFLAPIITVSSWAIDYAGVLNIGGAVFDWAINEYDIKEKSLHASGSDIEKGISTGLDFQNGKSLETVTNYWK